MSYRVIGGTSPPPQRSHQGGPLQAEHMLPGAPSAFGLYSQVQTPLAELGPSHRDSHVYPFSAESVSSICQVLEACSLLGGFEGIGCNWTLVLPSYVAALHDFSCDTILIASAAHRDFLKAGGKNVMEAAEHPAWLSLWDPGERALLPSCLSSLKGTHNPAKLWVQFAIFGLFCKAMQPLVPSLGVLSPAQLGIS